MTVPMSLTRDIMNVLEMVSPDPCIEAFSFSPFRWRFRYDACRLDNEKVIKVDKTGKCIGMIRLGNSVLVDKTGNSVSG